MAASALGRGYARAALGRWPARDAARRLVAEAPRSTAGAGLTAAALAAAAAAAAAVVTSRGGAGPGVTSCQEAPNRLAGWKARWDAQRTSWHLNDVNPYLKRYLKELLPGGTGGLGPRILIPLCGKTVDMAFLSRNGYRVVGVEGVAKAVEEFAAEHSATGAAVPVALPPDVHPERFRGHALMPRTDAETATTMPQPVIIVEGDFLALGPKEAQALVPFDAAFDRGGLVAVNPEDRARYVQVLADMVAPGGRILLVVVEHDPFANGTLGPPFEVTEADVRSLCGGRFDVKLLAHEDRLDQDKGMRERGVSRFHEVVYLLTRQKETVAK